MSHQLAVPAWVKREQYAEYRQRAPRSSQAPKRVEGARDESRIAVADMAKIAVELPVETVRTIGVTESSTPIIEATTSIQQTVQEDVRRCVRCNYPISEGDTDCSLGADQCEALVAMRHLMG